jgi:hypothetical protein
MRIRVRVLYYDQRMVGDELGACRIGRVHGKTKSPRDFRHEERACVALRK